MENPNIYEAEMQLSDLVDRALNGEEIIISKDGRPAARLVPIVSEESPRQGGQWKGRIRIADDFDTLPDDLAAAFGVEPA